MATTVLTFTPALVQDPSGTTLYRIQAAVTTKGDLPNVEVFLHQIIAPADPKQDVLVRVGNVNDLTTYSRDRVVAVTRGESYYLSSVVTVTQSSMSAASATIEAIKARVDQLVRDWVAYQADFAGVTTVDVPLVSASVVTAAKGAYVAARDARDAATDAVGSASATSEDATDAADRADDDLTETTARYASALGAQVPIVSSQSKLATYEAAIQTFVNAAAAYHDAHTTSGVTRTVAETAHLAFEGAYSTFTHAQVAGVAAKDELDGGVTLLGAHVSALLGEKATAVAAKPVADAAAAAAQTALIAAQAALVQAQAAYDAALARVVALCPTFDPSSV